MWMWGRLMFIELCSATMLGIKIMRISDLYFAINSVGGHVYTHLYFGTNQIKYCCYYFLFKDEETGEGLKFIYQVTQL